MPALIILFSITINRFASDILSNKVNSKQICYIKSLSMAIMVSLATILVISGEPWFKWGTQNAPLLVSDIWRTKLGVHLKQNSFENATIAVHAAGQISYYSDRKSIDLLGKSDSVVAKGPLAGNFRPGHNKWNYEYSIMKLKPHIVADEWGEVRKFLSNKNEYLRLGNGIYIRKKSQFINVDGLSQNYLK